MTTNPIQDQPKTTFWHWTFIKVGTVVIIFFAWRPLADYLDGMACQLYLAGKLDQAAPVTETLAWLEQKMLKPNDPELAETFFHLGEIYDSKGNYQRSKQLFSDAAEIFRHSPDSYKEKLANAIAYQGRAESCQGHTQEAQRLYREAVSIEENQSKPNQDYLAQNLISLSVVEHNAGNPAETICLLERVLAMEKDISPVTTASALSSLSSEFMSLKQFQRASHLAARALELYRQLNMKNEIETTLREKSVCDRN